MELDPRIIEGKTYLDCYDTEIAKEFIGKKGYFANYIQAFQDLESTDYQLVYATLKEVDSQRVIAFTDDFDGESSYFLPEEWVKEPEEKPEKKYRPYTLTEFVNTYSLGDEVIMRLKNNPTVKHVLFIECEQGRDDVRLGQYWYTFMVLFNNYEIWTDEGWKPFGVEE